MARLERLVEVDNRQAPRSGDIGKMAGQRDMPSAIQHPAFVPGQAALEEIVAEFAIGQCVDIDQDQPLFAIGDDRIIIDRMEGLLLIDLAQFLGVAQGSNRLVGGKRHAGRVFGGYMGVLAERGERRLDDPLREALVADRSDIIGAETAFAFRHEHIFSSQLETADRIARSLDNILKLFQRLGLARQFLVEPFTAHPVNQFPVVVLNMHSPIVGIGIFLQIGADHRLRFVPFGHPDRFKAFFQANPCMKTDEVDEIRPLQQRLRHDRVVVVGLTDMTVRALLGLGLAHGVREMRSEGL